MAVLLGTIVGLGCRDNAGPTAEGDASLLAVSYVCGRTFELRNGNPIAVTIEYTVAGNDEAGELTLAAGYGAEFFVATPDAGRITDVTWVRLSSVTHAFDENQRFNLLEFRRTAGGVTAVTPAIGALAPPGNYMLFIVDGDGVPSVAWIQRVG